MDRELWKGEFLLSSPLKESKFVRKNISFSIKIVVKMAIHNEFLSPTIYWSEVMKKSQLCAYILILLFICLVSPIPLHANDKIGLSKGETIYAPAYSHIYSGDSERPFLLTVTVSISTFPAQRCWTAIWFTMGSFGQRKSDCT